MGKIIFGKKSFNSNAMRDLRTDKEQFNTGQLKVDRDEAEVRIKDKNTKDND